jgi:UrcA family protein
MEQTHGDTGMNTQRSNRLGTLALAGLVLLASQAAFSQERPPGDREVVSATIDVRDVDVSTEQGARWVFRRIVSTAQTVCFGGIRRDGSRQWLSTQTAVARRCFDDSVTAAVARVQGATGVDVERVAALDRYDTAVASN